MKKHTHHCLQRFPSTPKVQTFLFYKYHTQVSVVLQEHHLFHKGSAVLSFHTLTQNHSISANFKLSLHQNANEFPGSVLPTIESNIFRQTKHTNYIYIYLCIQYVYVYFNIPSGGKQFFPSVFAPSFPHPTHIFSCKTLVVICTWEPPFFTKAPPKGVP